MIERHDRRQGLIGSWLGVLLDQNHSVRMIDTQPGQTHPALSTEADLRHPDRVLEACRDRDGALQPCR